MLRVAVNSAVNLPNIETIGKSDPYVVINFQGLFYLGLLFFFAVYDASSLDY